MAHFKLAEIGRKTIQKRTQLRKWLKNLMVVTISGLDYQLQWTASHSPHCNRASYVSFV